MMKPIRIAALSLFLLLVRTGWTDEPPAVPETAPPAMSTGEPPAATEAAPAATPQSIEDVVRDRVAKRIPGTVTSVRKMPFGMFEAIIDNEIVYVDEAVNYLVTGHVYDTRTQQDLTAKRSEEVLRVDFSELPLQWAFKIVRGDGSRPVAIFEDPNCPYCKRLEREIRTLNNTTIYVFLYPILSDDSVSKSTQIWCSKDPGAAWTKLMLDGQSPGKAAEGCKTPINDVLALGHKLSVVGTPTLVFADGRRAPGMIPLDRVEQMLNTAAHPQARN
jgi:thiol:disulfide interchange protein DsbC